MLSADDALTRQLELRLVWAEVFWDTLHRGFLGRVAETDADIGQEESSGALHSGHLGRVAGSKVDSHMGGSEALCSRGPLASHLKLNWYGLGCSTVLCVCVIWEQRLELW